MVYTRSSPVRNHIQTVHSVVYLYCIDPMFLSCNMDVMYPQ